MIHGSHSVGFHDESSVEEAENVIMSTPRVEWELENYVLWWRELSYVVYEDENDIPDLEESSESGVELESYGVNECDTSGAEGKIDLEDQSLKVMDLKWATYAV